MCFIIDADEEFYFKDKSWFKNLTKDMYNIKRLFGSIEYYQPVIINVRNKNQVDGNGKHRFIIIYLLNLPKQKKTLIKN